MYSHMVRYYYYYMQLQCLVRPVGINPDQQKSIKLGACTQNNSYYVWLLHMVMFCHSDIHNLSRINH